MFCYVWCWKSPTWYTADFWVSSESLRTEADRFVVGDVALGVGPAVAGVDAVSVEAGEGLQTVVIGLAANNNHRWNYHYFSLGQTEEISWNLLLQNIET